MARPASHCAKVAGFLRTDKVREGHLCWIGKREIKLRNDPEAWAKVTPEKKWDLEYMKTRIDLVSAYFQLAWLPKLRKTGLKKTMFRLADENSHLTSSMALPIDAKIYRFETLLKVLRGYDCWQDGSASSHFRTPYGPLLPFISLPTFSRA